MFTHCGKSNETVAVSHSGLRKMNEGSEPGLSLQPVGVGRKTKAWKAASKLDDAANATHGNDEGHENVTRTDFSGRISVINF